MVDEAVPGSTWRRLGVAVAISLVLHTVVVFNVRAGRGHGSSGDQTIVLTARLMPADHSDQTPAAAPAPATTTASAAEAPGAAARRSATPPRPEASGTLPLDITRTGYYYLASRLQKPPAALGQIQFEYPEDSPLRDGTVLARVLIDARGKVDEVIVEGADPRGVFDAVAVKALLRAQFSPGLLHNIAVPSQLMVEVRYQDPGSSTLPGVGISMTGRSP